jgi:ATP-dependent 26S proteasome regulatory subunit
MDASFGSQSPKCLALHVQTYLLGLQPQLNMLITFEQEEYIKEEQRSLKRELLRAQEEVKRIQSVPLVIGQFLEMVDGNSGIVGSTTGVPTFSALLHLALLHLPLQSLHMPNLLL